MKVFAVVTLCMLTYQNTAALPLPNQTPAFDSIKKASSDDYIAPGHRSLVAPPLNPDSSVPDWDNRVRSRTNCLTCLRKTEFKDNQDPYGTGKRGFITVDVQGDETDGHIAADKRENSGEAPRSQKEVEGYSTTGFITVDKMKRTEDSGGSEALPDRNVGGKWFKRRGNVDVQTKASGGSWFPVKLGSRGTFVSCRERGRACD